MFYYDGNSEEFEEIIEEYISAKNGAGAIDYRMGKGWPEFNLAAMEKATGLDGEEYGFNPERDSGVQEGITAQMPDFSAAGINLGESKCCGKCGGKCSHENQAHIHYHVDILDTDIDYMRNLSGEIVRRIRPVVNEVLNEFEYEASPVMGNDIDREFVAQLVDRALDKAAVSLDEVEDIMLDAEQGAWSRYRLLRCVFEAVILKELFGCRRPNYRRVMNWANEA